MVAACMHMRAVTACNTACNTCRRSQVATRQKLDLTDAFEEVAGKGRDAQLGLMAKTRFATTLCCKHMRPRAATARVQGCNCTRI